MAGYRRLVVAAVATVVLASFWGLFVCLYRGGSFEKTAVWTTRYDFQPYHFLTDQDVRIQKRWLGIHFRRPRILPAEETPEFHIATVRLNAGQVLESHDLVDASGIAPPSILSLPATPEILMGGALKRGDVVMLFAYFPARRAYDGPGMIALWNVTILDVPERRERSENRPGAVIVAIPRDDRYQAFLEHYGPGSLIVASVQ